MPRARRCGRWRHRRVQLRAGRCGAVIVVADRQCGRRVQLRAFSRLRSSLAGLRATRLVGAALMRLTCAARIASPISPPTSGAFYARALPGVLAAGIPQLVLIVGTIVASPSSSAASWLYYAYRLYELPLGIISIAIAAVLTPPHRRQRRREGPRRHRRSTIARIRNRARARAARSNRSRTAVACRSSRVLFERGAFGRRRYGRCRRGIDRDCRRALPAMRWRKC